MGIVQRIQQIISIVTAITAFILAMKELSNAFGGIRKKKTDDDLSKLKDAKSESTDSKKVSSNKQEKQAHNEPAPTAQTDSPSPFKQWEDTHGGGPQAASA